MIVTSVDRDKKNKNMLRVYIDGKFSFSIPEEDYLRLNLYEKKEISQEEIEHIKDNIIFRAAKLSAVKYLALRLRCEGDVRQKLAKEGYGRDIIEKVIEEVKALGYINDKLFVQKYIYDRSKLKPKSKKMLKMELKNKGIAEDIINEVIDDWKMDDSIVAESLVLRKFGKYDLKDEKIIKRIYSFLHHRGFNYETIEGVISKVCK